MKRKRILSLILALVTMFTMLGQFAAPVSAVKAKDVGISVKSSQFYNHNKNCYRMQFDVTKSKNSTYRLEGIPLIKAYLLNAEGDTVMKWTNSGKGFPVEDDSRTMKFDIDAKKLKSGEYTLKFYVCCEYYDANWKLCSSNMYWKYTLKKSDMVQSIKFKQMSYMTDSQGRTVPRVNIVCRNIKGQSLTIYYYDKYDNCINTFKGNARKTDNESAWFTWTGVEDGGQYPDGTYKVKVETSGGMSITEEFYFDFPGYKK